ncbi:tRNA-dihydrouridine synthase 2, variant 2 [Entomophthora muscae]|uniref:tRNA-dihydrouridine synthase 2, variant 2 n=1 Tax=Entomophthora muscae TaxID=34485 RepID=A0ACC2T251_9FUNG|nr:tRNA-dihydrouridine synthase 2, variant 2 [Entomophthora muscae]
MKKGTLNFRTSPLEKSKLVFQLGTADPDLALEAALTVIQDVSAVDLNCGCPKKFSISGGMGAALLSDPDRLIKILEKLVTNLPVPVSCKIRTLDSPDATLELCRRIEKTGVHALAVHCRTREERPSQPAHWDRLTPIVAEIDPLIPIIINGDVFLPKHISKARAATGVSSVMIARGAMINPCIFDTKGEPATQREAVIRYMRHAINYDFPYQNVKYTLMQMYDDPKTPEFLSLQNAKSMRAIR